MLYEILAVFYLLDDKSVIHIPEPKPVWNGSHADSLGFKLHDQVGYYRADGGTHGCTRDLFIILTLEEETCILQAKLQ